MAGSRGQVPIKNEKNAECWLITTFTNMNITVNDINWFINTINNMIISYYFYFILAHIFNYFYLNYNV